MKDVFPCRQRLPDRIQSTQTSKMISAKRECLIKENLVSLEKQSFKTPRCEKATSTVSLRSTIPHCLSKLAALKFRRSLVVICITNQE